MTALNNTAGFWRRVEIHPSPGQIVAGLEDDFHRFTIRLDHADGVVTGIDAQAERYPWSTCPAATEFLAEQMTGKALREISRLDPHEHCTHLFDLVIVCASHAFDNVPTTFDLFVADWENGKTVATLTENHRERVRWEVDGTLIEAPAGWAGRNLRQLSTWRSELTPVEAEQAMLLRRAIFVSNGRKPENQQLLNRASDRGAARMGACFTYQMPRAENALPMTDSRIDFSRADRVPLQGFHRSSASE